MPVKPRTDKCRNCFLDILNAWGFLKSIMGTINDKATKYRNEAPVNDPKTWDAILVAMKVPPHMMATKINLM